ncbi:MAG: dTDP-4-dehydrorhamnose reductase [Burkholderiales bacterium]|nr:dTDP-4-dehydrorhamnose reductase [Burkholderiales bacterium]
MKILLLGPKGQLGWELRRSLAPLGQVIALDRHGEAGLCGDLADAEGLAATVRALKPQVIVNAGAYTAVDRAESEPALAERINAAAPAVLAREAAACGALLAHYSTDYVFDGSGERPWREDDATGPLSVYGRTKLAGEQAIVQSGCAHLILRTSWVHAARGGNFARTMLRLGAERERLSVIDDQWGAPTGAELIADVSAHALAQLLRQPDKVGIYHLAAAGETNWFSYAKYVFAQAQQAQPAIKLIVRDIAPITTADYPTAAQRPHNSRLDTRKLQAAFDLALPPWQDGVRRMLQEILQAP